MADGDRFNINSIEYLHLTFGLWHWDLNAVVPLWPSCSHTQFTRYFRDTTLGTSGRFYLDIKTNGFNLTHANSTSHTTDFMESRQGD
jgi:hypothetical protein